MTGDKNWWVIKGNGLINKIVLGLWVLLISIVITLMHSWHLISFELPSFAKSPSKHQAFDDREMNQWYVYHILGEGCSCSTLIMNFLTSRKELDGVNEKILWVGKQDTWKKKAENNGFAFELVNYKEKSELAGLPAMLIFDGAKQKYTGGYANRFISTTAHIQADEIIKKTMSRNNLASLPIRGCALSKRLQDYIDPLNIKYGSP